MGLRERDGKWHWRFSHQGKEWSGSTDLAATKRNEAAARDIESQARRLVRNGQGDQLRLQVMAFSEAADAFIAWAQGEYRAKPNTWKRLRASCTSLKAFFSSHPLHAITVGQVEDFKSWRRKMNVQEVTIRHDMHCLSPLFEYGRKHNWCIANPVEHVEIPSDKDAIRFHLVKPAEEMLYFAEAKRRNPELHDIARLMLLQGPRPSEVMSANKDDVDLAAGEWRIPDSKSAAGRRTLHLTPESLEILAARVMNASPRGWLFAGKKPGAHMVDAENGHIAILNASRPAPGKPRVIDFVLYDFRHTFATRMAQRGCDIATLAAILGHANLRTVQRYIHIGREQQKAAMLKYGTSFVSDVPRTKKEERAN